MKKILKSFLLLSIVAMSSVLATQAYFTDVEESTENVFQAGAIDLKIDSEAHYNGLVCRDGYWENACELSEDNLLTNGGFETPIVTKSQKWDIFPDGATGLGWQVDWESTITDYGGYTRPDPAELEFHRGAMGAAADGSQQYVELDTDWYGPGHPQNGEPAIVKISQNVATTIGKKYQLSYYYSPRPNTSTDDNKLSVLVDGVEVDSQQAAGASSINWTYYAIEFEAVSASTQIAFTGTDADTYANSIGIFLDEVSVQELDCASDFDEYEGEVCVGTFPWTDLSAEQFFLLDDVKPGDWGENTISLHIYDNDANACLYFENLRDDDPTLTEPEENEGGDTSVGDGNGELSQNLSVLLWHDDGDNILQEEEILISDGIQPASQVFSSHYFLGMYPASIDKFIGIAWCAGEMAIEAVPFELSCDGAPMGNEAQTDSLTVDLRFYVEQTRHNENFQCPTDDPPPTSGGGL
jgi:predicted ribosomally synthesized peptide with SipW-like signal peptide